MMMPSKIWASEAKTGYGEWQDTQDGLPMPLPYIRADIVEELVEALMVALEPFAQQADTFDSDGVEYVPDQFEPAIVGHTIGDLRRARAAYREASK